MVEQKQKMIDTLYKGNLILKNRISIDSSLIIDNKIQLADSSFLLAQERKKVVTLTKQVTILKWLIPPLIIYVLTTTFLK